MRSPGEHQYESNYNYDSAQHHQQFSDVRHVTSLCRTD
jgi:hypothetical protein